MRVNGGRAIVPNVIKAVEVARHRGILVIWVCIFLCLYELLALFVSMENIYIPRKKESSNFVLNKIRV
jgi:nicotinamidase-related amidase